MRSAPFVLLLISCVQPVHVQVAAPATADGGIFLGAASYDVDLYALGGGAACPSADDVLGGSLGSPLLTREVALGQSVALDTTLAPGRYAIAAIGRDAAGCAFLYDALCFGPEAPPRVLALSPALCDAADLVGGACASGRTYAERSPRACR